MRLVIPDNDFVKVYVDMERSANDLVTDFRPRSRRRTVGLRRLQSATAFNSYRTTGSSTTCRDL